MQKWDIFLAWDCKRQNYKGMVNDITGEDLAHLRQEWESNTAEECWFNDKVQ